MARLIATKQDVLTILTEHQTEIRDLGIKQLGLFGSFVRDEATGDSDVDLLVEFETGQKSFDNFMQLSFLLQGLLDRPVELVTPESLSVYLRPYIMSEVEHVPIINQEREN